MAKINEQIAVNIINSDKATSPEQLQRRASDLNKYLDLEGIAELAKPPSATIYESTFKKYVIPFYIERTEESRLNLINLLRGNLRCEIIVLDDSTKEELFRMPPPFAEFQYLTPVDDVSKNHILVKVFDEFFSKIDNSTPIAIDNMAKAIANTPVSIDISDDLKILIILIKYGHIPTKLYNHFKSLQPKASDTDNNITTATAVSKIQSSETKEMDYDWD